MVETVGEPAVQQVSLPCFPSAFLVPSGGLALTGSGCCIVADHKFKIGQMVFFHPRSRGVDTTRGRPFQITQRLPATDGGEPQYRIRSTYVEQPQADVGPVNPKPK